MTACAGPKEETVPTYYKVLGENGEAVNGGKGKWPLPKHGKPGAWKSLRGKLVPCLYALHGCTENQLMHWLGPAIYEMEFAGQVHDDGNKYYGRKARLLRRLDAWNDRTARLFACDCAERALLRERAVGREPDKRAWDATEVARRYAAGGATSEELAAARDAARDAARAAAGSAAWSAARDAARDAAWDAAGAAERKWQTERLILYLQGEQPPPVLL